MQVPPHNGFGDEVDSLGYVYDLVPKKPKIDFFKYVDNDKKILRYTARFNTKVPEDLDRRFIISFYLADDTISIFEPAQKNSGIIEGPFLERRKYKNVDKQMEFITPTEMPVGGDIKINGYNFHVLDCDEYTTKYLATHTYEWEWAAQLNPWPSIEQWKTNYCIWYCIDHVKDFDFVKNCGCLSVIHEMGVFKFTFYIIVN